RRLPGCPSRLLHLDDAHSVVAVIHVLRELVVQPRLGLLQTVNPVGHAEPVHHTVLLRHQFSPFSKRSIVPNDTGIRPRRQAPPGLLHIRFHFSSTVARRQTRLDPLECSATQPPTLHTPNGSHPRGLLLDRG